MNNYVVAFDTANEMISLGIGLLDRAKKTIDCIASREVGAFRASNVKLLPEIDALLADAGISRGEVACVVCGRGPGSFTGVRICLASAKGIAIGLGVPLFGVSTSDAQAWQQWANGARGSVVVLGDAMRKEVYPIRYQPLEAAWVPAVAAMESQVMGTDAWSEAQVLDELPRPDRTWWAAFEVADTRKRTVNVGEAKLVGYAGGWINDGQVQLLKVASDPAYRRQGIAQELLARIALDARDLGAKEMTLEVRASNTGAHAFYERLGLKNIGIRPRYYSDGENACIYEGPLPLSEHDVAGMELRLNAAAAHAGEAAGDCVPLEGKLILAIESSCDETAAALIDEAGTIVADVVASQIDFHSRFGGVVPEIASRKHIEAIGGVVIECLAQARERTGKADLSWNDLAAVSVTYAPGLVGALVVGAAFAKGLAWACDVPLIGVNHLEGHLYANKIACPDIKPPMVVSLVSGGHTMLVHVKDWGSYETMGSTLDDAVGEAFDKVAKAMGLGYPGGPLISALAEKGNPKAVRFPRALMHSGDLQFSLSGLKTSVRQTGAKEFCLGGGVAANPELRHAYEAMCHQIGVRLTMPPLSACTDNAAMIALVALDRYKQGKFFGLDCDVKAHAPLDEAY